jgi:transcriptional regulator with XRE-family HTH domain
LKEYHAEAAPPQHRDLMTENVLRGRIPVHQQDRGPRGQLGARRDMTVRQVEPPRGQIRAPRARLDGARNHCFVRADSFILHCYTPSAMPKRSKYAAPDESAHPVDVLVGKRLRMRRVEKSLSQGEVARAVGITFQQIQKYERGTNRISCSRLFELARCLDVPITYFFDEDRGRRNPHLAERLEVKDVKDGMRLIAAFQRLGDRATRRRFIELLEVAGSRPARAGNL